MVQNLTLDATVSNSSSFDDGMMGTDDLHTLADGTTADSPSGDYIRGSSATDGLIMHLSDADDPEVATGHKIYYDVGSQTGPPPPGGGPTTMYFSLLQGSTEIVSDEEIADTSDGTFGTYTLSASEANSITDYDDLRIELKLSGSGLSTHLYCIYMEIPDAPTQTLSPAFLMFME